MEEFLGPLRLAFESCLLEFPVPPFLGKPLVKAKLTNSALTLKEKPLIEIKCMADKIKTEFTPEKPYDEIREGMTEVGDGIFKRTLTDGYGEMIKENFEITVQYTMFLEDKPSVQDSTYLAQEPYTFVLGKQRGLLPSFEAAVRTMRNQEKAEFIIPRYLFQNEGKTPTETEQRTGYLMLEVIRVTEMVGKKEKARLLNNLGLTLKRAQELRERGKAAFIAKFYHVAADEYLEATYLLRNVLVQSSLDNEKRLQLLLRIYLNAGVTYNKMEHPGLAHGMLRRAVNLIENDGFDVRAVDMLRGKIYLHMSRALRQMNNHSKAFIYYSRAKKCLGDVQEIKDEFKILSLCFDKKMTEVFILGHANETDDVDSNADSIHMQNHDVFEAAFDQMLKAFKGSKDKERTIYGVQGNGYVEVAEEVAKKNKINLDASRNDQGTVRYVLTRK